MSGQPQRSILLEVCITSVEDALHAAAGGAGRLELNAALALGGLTPSLGTFLEIKKSVALPVFVMARPRPGGFCYSDADLAVMHRDIDLFVEHGADGIVFGVLHEDGRVDEARCRQILRQIGALPAVFHRAFDMTPDALAALEQLIGLGVKRVMTSGQQDTACNGASLIAELVRLGAGRIEVLPAGGINRFTVADVVARTECNQVHASLRHSVPDRSTSLRPQISLAGSTKTGQDSFDTTSLTAIIELCKLLKGLSL